jgi:hypothetical protein
MSERNFDEQKQKRAESYENIARNAYAYGPAISGASQIVSDRAEGGVVRSVRRMEKQLMELGATVETLTERLSMVRIPSPGSTQGGDKTAEGSSLAAQLSNYNQVLDCQTARLQQLIQELDL